MNDCVFCRIVAGEIPAVKIYEDEAVVAFMDAGQVNEGHVIVATRSHAETILDLDDELAGEVFKVAARIARAAESAFGPDGITVLQANKPAGWQTVAHFHMHVLPRHSDDGVNLTWPAKNPAPEQLQSLAARLLEHMPG